MTDLHKLKGVRCCASGCGCWHLLVTPPPPVLTQPTHSLTTCPQTEAVKFSRNNPDMQPFEAGGEGPLESHCGHQNCSLFALGSHQKKRPHNLILGRLFDFRLYDMVEFGVAAYRPIRAFGGGAALAQLGNKVRLCVCGAGAVWAWMFDGCWAGRRGRGSGRGRGQAGRHSHASLPAPALHAPACSPALCLRATGLRTTPPCARSSRSCLTTSAAARRVLLCAGAGRGVGVGTQRGGAGGAAGSGGSQHPPASTYCTHHRWKASTSRAWTASSL